ncbi:GntR family transcriptional regulator [Pseudogemmobacter faecipullorum]|nr:GntR family transcriptional regulator [Pseudogemmobacter faecipullorum]
MVYELLRDQILDLELPPGAIVDENQLAERFGMSRTPIREALVRLAAEGLIDTLPNRSTMVSNIDFPNLHTFFDALTLMYRVTTRLAAEYHQPEDLVAIRQYQKAYELAVKDGDEIGLVAANREFHYAIAEAGRNRYYLALFGRLLDEGRRILRLYYYGSGTGDYPQIWFDEHEAIVAAVAARDIEAADRIARQHANQIVSQIQAAITRDRRQDIDI